jgi:predicted RNA-binding Zn-ribbon protein involved in translation (DUF1610 family)
MPVVKCPSCGQRGATEPGSEACVGLGEWEGQAAFKCRRCGSAMALRHGRFGSKAVRIDATDVSDLECPRAGEIDVSGRLAVLPR